MKILYIMSSYNIYGGTPKKTLDLMKSFKENSSLYVYSNQYLEFKELFEITNANIYEGNYGRNIFLHIRQLLKIIDNDNIDIVQTQFSMGETLGYFIKLFRPKIKLIIAFVAPFEPQGIKKIIVNQIYKKVDSFVFISEYVKKAKIKQFPILKIKESNIIFNGTALRVKTDDSYPKLNHTALLDVAGLSDWKNINVLLEAMNIIVNNLENNEVYLYVAGDGPERQKLEEKIKRYALEKHIFLLGYQKNIGALLDECDIYVHPAYAEGFGIAVAEAMMASKPTIVSDAGALPELIGRDQKAGLIVDQFDPRVWAEAILKLIENPEYAHSLGLEAKTRAEKEFSIEKYISNYKNLYESLLDN
jgi:glycosyltransferase involved in cell wall biosynthesis